MGAQKIAALGRPSADAGRLEDYLDERTTAANALRAAIAAAKEGDMAGFEAAVAAYGRNAAQEAATRFGFKTCGLGAGRLERRATGDPARASAGPAPAGQLRVQILDARLFTDGRPSGVQEQRARMTVRIRVSNPGSRSVTLGVPALRVGSLRIATDSERADARIAALPPGTEQTVSLRFALAGAATPKVVRDRRARVLIAGQSVATRVRVRGPAG